MTTSNGESSLKDLGQKINDFANLTISSLIDAIFLVIWVLAQWLLSSILKNFELSGFDQLVLSVFQALFAFSTLAPIVVYIYRDIRIVISRAQRIIDKEEKLRKEMS